LSRLHLLSVGCDGFSSLNPAARTQEAMHDAPVSEGPLPIDAVACVFDHLDVSSVGVLGSYGVSLDVDLEFLCLSQIAPHLCQLNCPEELQQVQQVYDDLLLSFPLCEGVLQREYLRLPPQALPPHLD